MTLLNNIQNDKSKISMVYLSLQNKRRPAIKNRSSNVCSFSKLA